MTMESLQSALSVAWKGMCFMIKFDENKQRESVNGALALRPLIEEYVDEITGKGIRNVCFLGIGGTYASALQVECHIKSHSAYPVCVENAAYYTHTGNRNLGKGTLVVFSSVSGTTFEVMEAVEALRSAGAVIWGFVDVADSPLAEMCDYLISYPMNEQLKFFMLADRLMYLAGDFEDYSEYYQEMDRYLAQALIDVEKSADAFGAGFAKKHHRDSMHYFIAAGNQYGAAYSYAMCYWEEQHWLRTKSIHAAEFFHGTLEIVEEDTAVTLFLGEDAERPLAQRVAGFLPKVCNNYTLVDTRDYTLSGISDKYRGRISHLVMHAITQRMDGHIEALNQHDMTIRRYYRKMEY